MEWSILVFWNPKVIGREIWAQKWLIKNWMSACLLDRDLDYNSCNLDDILCKQWANVWPCGTLCRGKKELPIFLLYIWTNIQYIFFKYAISNCPEFINLEHYNCVTKVWLIHKFATILRITSRNVCCLLYKGQSSLVATRLLRTLWIHEGANDSFLSRDSRRLHI